MVKIKNVYGDEYRGKQKHAVYQKRYGKQIRRLKEDKKANRAPGQKEQQRRFKVGLSWYKSLSYEEKEGLKFFLDQRGITLTTQQYAIKTALDRGKVSKEVFEEQVITWVYKEGWDLKGWPYRQEVTLTNNTANDLTDYQVKLILDASKVGPHFDWAHMGADLRFYDENGNKLSYYIESWDKASEQAIVWVKVGLIPANGQATIKMYYSNSEAVGESNPDQVFDFFDDFAGPTVDTEKWNIGKGNANGRVEIVDDSGVSALLLDPVDNVTNACAVYTKTAFLTNGFIVEERRKFTSQYYVDIGLCKDEPTAFNYWHISEGASQNEYAFQTQRPISGTGDSAHIIKQVDGEVTKLASTGDKPLTSTGAYHLTRVIYTQDGKLIYEHIPSTGQAGWYLQATDTTFLNDPKYLLLWQGEYSTGDGGASYIDWVRVRKYAEQEPSIEFGAEEYGLTEGLATIQVEHIVIEHSGMQKVMILDENGELIKEYTGLSDIAAGDIATRLDFVNRTGKTVRTVIIESISGVLNKWIL